MHLGKGRGSLADEENSFPALETPSLLSLAFAGPESLAFGLAETGPQ